MLTGNLREIHIFVFWHFNGENCTLKAWYRYANGHDNMEFPTELDGHFSQAPLSPYISPDHHP